MTLQGTHKARAREWGLGHSTTGKEQVAVLFEITAGPSAGKTITWYGYFTDGTTDRTLDALRYCGWEGDNFVELEGLDRNEVEIEIVQDTYEGRTKDKVKWVNRPARLTLKDQMSPVAQAAFAARMRAKAIEHRQARGTVSSGSRSTTNPDADEPDPFGKLPF